MCSLQQLFELCICQPVENLSKGDRIYRNQIDDQTLRRPDHSRWPDPWPDSHRDQNVKIRSPIWSPGAIWSPIWSSDEACFISHLFKRPLIFAQKAQLQSNLVTQERSSCPKAIWPPIRSPGHLVVVDAFSLSLLPYTNPNATNVFYSHPGVHFFWAGECKYWEEIGSQGV